MRFFGPQPGKDSNLILMAAAELYHKYRKAQGHTSNLLLFLFPCLEQTRKEAIPLIFSCQIITFVVFLYTHLTLVCYSQGKVAVKETGSN